MRLAHASFIVTFSAAILILSDSAFGIDVTTQRYDNARTGANLAEGLLNTANVNVQQFGKLFSRSVDGQIYAQPLYLSSLNMGTQGMHNVVYVATEHNSVFAFDADVPGASSPLWQTNLGTPATNVDVSCNDLQPEIGITSTPVIDRTSNTLYVVNKSKANGSFFNMLHALDLITGQEKFNGPVTITATVPGTGLASVNGMITFDPLRHFNRPALLLLNGLIYIGFGSHCDNDPYHGWLFAYDAATLARTAVLNLSPGGGQAALWQGGNGPAADANGSIYLMTGNGTFDASSGGADFGCTYLQLLSTNGNFSVQSWFTPHDVAALNSNDLDVGAGGPLLIPGTTLVVGAGKTGTLYVLRRGTLGGFDPNTDHVVQTISGVSSGGGNNPNTSFWASSSGAWLYIWSGSDVLKAYSFNGSLFQTPPSSQNTLQQMVPTGAISVSSNGMTVGSGIVWGTTNSNGTGVLHAYDAGNVSHELWNSGQNSARDAHGSFAKFSVPTVANGRVYASTFSNRLDVYGLLPAGLNVAITSPADGSSFSAPANITITVTASDTSGTISRVDYFNGQTSIGSSTTAPYTFVWNNVPAGTYAIHAVATDSTMATSTSNIVNVSVTTSGGLPSPWLQQDIGNVGAAGGASYSSGVFSVSASGTDIWGGQDQFHFVYQPLSGNGQITARVSAIQNTNSWAKAGVMIRETLTDNSTHAFMCVTPANGTALQRRTATGSGSVSTTGPNVTAPYWVRVTRSGNTFTGFVSSDGVNWVQVGSDTISMSANVFVGLALSAHDNTAVNTSTFDAVVVQGGSATNNPPTVTLTAPTDGATFTSPANIPLAATASDPDGSIARVDFYNGTTLITTDTTSPYTATWSNVAAGSYSITAVATDNNGASTTSNVAHVSVSQGSGGGGLPPPWVQTDIGSTSPAGSATFSNNVFTESGAGADIWGDSDAFHYVYQPLNGNGSVTARVTGVQNTNSWAKAGVMIRQTLTAGSAHALMALTPGNGTSFQRRTQTGNGSASTAGPIVSAPYWVRITRVGSTFTGAVSTDGVAWVTVGSDSITMPSGVFVGLAVCSHMNGTLNTSTFDNVTVQTSGTNNPPSVAITSPVDGASFSSPATITIQATASDSDGTVARVDFYNGTALLGSSTTAPYSFTWNAVPDGNYALTAIATDNQNASTTSAVVYLSVGSGGGLPAPWVDRDIGNAGVAGSASFTSGTFSVSGSGADIWNAADAFNFMYQPIVGDVTVTARVSSVQPTDSWAKAGVMIRQSLSANSAHAMMCITPGNGTSFQRRLQTDAVSVSTSGGTAISAPYWIRLVRRGNVLTAYQSSTGTTFTQVGSDTVTMTGTVYAGLSVTAHNNSVLNTSTFTDVTVTSP